eukprot:8739792-Pyramimonas_sp.AAC.1
MPHCTRHPRPKARRKKAQPQGGGLPGVGRAARQAGSQGRGGHSKPKVERVSVGGGPRAPPRPRE